MLYRHLPSRSLPFSDESWGDGAMRKFKTSGWKSAGLARSNTSSSIRGKISAPIPISSVNDDEFPIRARGNSIATPLGKDGEDTHLRPPAATDRDERSPLKEEEELSAPGMASMEPSMATSSAVPSVATSHASSLLQGRQVSPMRGSGVTATPTSGVIQLQRKQSTVRTLLGRLFGRKRRSAGSSTSASTGGQQADSSRMNPHRSDPSALRRPGDLALSPQRSTSMPINEYSRALTSHAPFPAGRQARRLNDDRDAKDEDASSRPRRSSTSRRYFEPARTMGYTGLSPRPASSHARGSGLFIPSSSSPIGYAVTSGSNPHRRSRSVGDLRDQARQSTFRRRSDEIRYLRESYDPDALSPLSLEHNIEFDTAQENDVSREEDVPDAPQPFNFGTMGDLAGMKITEAASLESRVSTLETRVEEVEKAMSHLIRRTPSSSLAARPKTGSSEPSLPRHAPREIYLQSNNPQAYRTPELSFESSRPSTTSTQASGVQSYDELSPHPTYQLMPEPLPDIHRTHSLLQSESMARPLSTTTTIRAIGSSSPSRSPSSSVPLAKNGSLTAHHYSALMNFIMAEQAARHELEAQVASLQMQLQTLTTSSTPRAIDRFSLTSGSRPHRVPGHHKTMGMAGEFSAFEHESASASQSDSDDEGEAYTSGNEEEDVYETPSEEKQHVLYESDNETGGEQRHSSEPRTLSLSQLTMRKEAMARLDI